MSPAGDAWRGPKNPRYNGGFCTHKGRTMVCCRDGTVMWWSRVLMWDHLGRPLRSDEIVHHVNGDGSDDRVENLQIVTRAEHAAIHRQQLYTTRREAQREREAQLVMAYESGASRQEVAAMLGISPDSVSNLAAKLRRRGVLARPQRAAA